VGGGLLLAGPLFERLAVYRAGTQSAADPKCTVVPQRERAARKGIKSDDASFRELSLLPYLFPAK
jgi:hypothetical protein